MRRQNTSALSLQCIKNKIVLVSAAVVLSYWKNLTFQCDISAYGIWHWNIGKVSLNTENLFEGGGS